MIANESRFGDDDALAMPMPVEQRGTDALIENVYQQPLAEMPDMASVAVAETFLESRFLEDPTKSRQIVRRSIGLPSYPARIPNGEARVDTYQKTNEWRVSPKAAAVMVLGSFALANTVPIAQTVEGAARIAGHAIYRQFNPLQERTDIRYTPGRSETISVKAISPNNVGVAEVRREEVIAFATGLTNMEKQGGTITEIKAKGETSDEFGDDASIGRISEGDTILGMQRATVSAEALKEIMGASLPVKEIKKEAIEHVVENPDDRQALLADAQAEGYAQITGAIAAVDNGQNAGPALTEKIKTFFTSKRGATLEATVTMPGKAVAEEVRTKEVDNPPQMPDVDWVPFAVPILPWRKRERVPELREQRRWALKPGKRLFLKPKVIEKNWNTAWVRLRPEALQKDGTLVDSPWAYTRKYEALLREDRITSCMRADYQIPQAGDKPAVDKALRIMFVDHTPAEETVSAFSTLLQTFANIQDGRLADKISGIFVYPSSQAGREHGDPKKIGLGVDKQNDANTLGHIIPILELVEMHMDTGQDAEALLKQFASYLGPTWTLAHEVAGHGSDLVQDKQTLEPVRAAGIANAHLVQGNSLEAHMAVADDLPSIDAHRKNGNLLRFDIQYTVQDAAGQTVTLRDRVYENDPRLPFATRSKIVGTRHTHYAEETALEHHAEVAAAVTTGIGVAYAHADISIDGGKTAQGAFAIPQTTGYRPDTTVQRVVTQAIGAEERSYPATFVNPLQVVITPPQKPEDDPWLREHLIRARSNTFASPGGMIAILAKLVQRR